MNLKNFLTIFISNIILSILLFFASGLLDKYFSSYSGIIIIVSLIIQGFINYKILRAFSGYSLPIFIVSILGYLTLWVIVYYVFMSSLHIQG